MAQPDNTETVTEESTAEVGSENNAAEDQQDESTEVEAVGVEAEKTDSDDEAEDGGDELPVEVLREKLTKANAEAANYRTKLREAEKAVKAFEGYVSPEDRDSAVEQGRLDLLAENVALKYKLPPKLQKRLVGNTREELEADAKELAADFADTNESLHLEGGLSPRKRDGSNSMNPGELALKHGSRKRR